MKPFLWSIVIISLLIAVKRLFRYWWFIFFLWKYEKYMRKLAKGNQAIIKIADNMRELRKESTYSNFDEE